MASSRKLKGITIEINGNTQGLQDSLKEVNKAIGSTSKELKDINGLLKLDPTNVVLLEQKQKVLSDAIQVTSHKLQELRTAKEQADARIASGAEEENSASYRELVREIEATESNLNGLKSQLDQTSQAMESNSGSVDEFAEAEDKAGQKALTLGDLIKSNLISSAITSGLKTLANGMKEVVGGVINLGKESISSFADYEQLVGGVETLFKGSAGVIEEYANNAYKTAGISANQYMEQATSFSASLLQSLGGDTKKAADVTDMAIKDMADNANKMGTSMESIQNAYQGFAKQNYTMLDNLKLGYGGTKTEMQRLLQDAEKFSGVHYDINNLSDVYNAIHVIQGELDITGTTAKEASGTISGSANAMKSAWKNMLTGLAGGGDNISKLLDNLVDSVLTFADNLMPVVQTVADSIVEILPEVLNKIIENLPQFLEAGINILNSLIQGISENLPAIIEAVLQIIGMLVNTLIENLPTIIQMGITLIVELVKGIAQSLPTLIPQMINALITMVTTLLDNIDLIIDAGIQLIMGLADGLMNALPDLIDRIPEIIDSLIMAITNNLPKLMKMGMELTIKLAVGLIKAIPNLIAAIPKIIVSIVKGFGNYLKNMVDLGKDIIKGIISGFANFDIGSAIKKTCKKMVSGIKSFFGIHSPSRLMKKEVGRFLPMGIAEGFESEIPNTIDKVENAMSKLNTGIQASVNPTINPQANSNPLIIQIENFNNQRGTDVQALAEELEFYRKNSSLAVGGK